MPTLTESPVARLADLEKRIDKLESEFEQLVIAVRTLVDATKQFVNEMSEQQLEKTSEAD